MAEKLRTVSRRTEEFGAWATTTPNRVDPRDRRQPRAVDDRARRARAHQVHRLRADAHALAVLAGSDTHDGRRPRRNRVDLRLDRGGAHAGHRRTGDVEQGRVAGKPQRLCERRLLRRSRRRAGRRDHQYRRAERASPEPHPRSISVADNRHHTRLAITGPAARSYTLVSRSWRNCPAAGNRRAVMQSVRRPVRQSATPRRPSRPSPRRRTR